MTFRYLDKDGAISFWTNIKNFVLSKIPTKTSELTNDSGFLTQHQSLSNYVTLNSSQTISGAKTFSSTITGSISGNAGTATQFSANKSVTLTGDVTGTASSKAGWSVSTTLSNSGVTAGTYGPSEDVTGNNNATISVPEITVDSKGRVTSVTNRTLTCKNNTYNVYNKTLTIQKNGTNVATFTSNSNTNVTANITVPTKTSELTNDSNFLTTSSSLNASKLTGTIDIARLPQGALERVITVADQTARFALTTSSVQLGDTVKQLDTGVMYVVVNESKLNSNDGYLEYTAGSASSVPWSGITSKPTKFTPSSHTHTKSEITDFPTNVSAFTNDSGYLTSHQSLSNYVTLNTAQEITNTKTFKDATTARKLTSVEAGNVIPTSDKLISDIWQDKNGKELGRIYYSKTKGGNTALIMRAGDYFSESEGVYSLNTSGTNRRAELHLYSDSSGNCCIKPVGYFSTTLKALSTSVWLGESTKPFGRVYANAFEFCNAGLLPDTDVQTSEEHSIGFYGQNNTPLSYITFQKRPNLKDRIAVRVQTAVSAYKSYCFDATCFYPENNNNLDIGCTTNIFKNIYCNNYYKGTTAFGDIVTHNASEFSVSGHTHSASDITSGLATVATSGSYNDLSNKPTIPTVNNATLTIQKNGTTVKTFTANASSNVTANITVPTKVSELTNDSGYLTSHQSLANYLTKTTNVSEMGRYIDLHYDNATSKYDYDARLYVDSQGTAAGGGSFKIAAASAYAPAPASNANDTRIATTAWVNSKGYLTSHPSITLSSNTSSTASPAHGGTFTCIDSVTQDTNGHITKVNTKTVTLPSDSNTDTLMTQNVSTTDSTYPILLCATANATSNQGAKTGIFGSGVKVNPKTSIVSAKGFSGIPTGNTYVNAVKDGGALVNSQATAWGAIWRAPTKDYQVAGATWSNTNNNVYICYSVTNANAEAGTNTMAKSLVWAADTGTLTTTTFSGALSGNASSATEFSTNKSVTLTGDVTGTVSSKAGWSVATTLANSGVTAGTYGPSVDVTGSNNATILVPEITVDAKGRVTAVNNRTYTSVNTDSDKKVYQYYKSDDNVYRLLFSNNAGNTATSNVGAVYSGLNNSFYVNPSTGSLYATKLYSNGVEVLTSHQSLSSCVKNSVTNNQTIKSTGITRGTAPSSAQAFGLGFSDNNDKYIGNIYGQYATDKSTYVGLYAYKGTTTANGDNASVRVGYDASGNAYTYAPTPATADNSTQIATTAFVKAQGYLTSHQSLANYVTTNTDQSISGIKSHSKHISILGDYIGNESSTNSRSCLYLKANRDTDGKSGLYVTKFRQNVAQGSMGNSDVVFLSHDILENETRTNAGFVESYSNWANDVPGGVSIYSTIATRNLGTSAKPWTNAYAVNIYENGTALSSKYALNENFGKGTTTYLYIKSADFPTGSGSTASIQYNDVVDGTKLYVWYSVCNSSSILDIHPTATKVTSVTGQVWRYLGPTIYAGGLGHQGASPTGILGLFRRES